MFVDGVGGSICVVGGSIEGMGSWEERGRRAGNGAGGVSGGRGDAELVLAAGGNGGEDGGDEDERGEGGGGRGGKLVPKGSCGLTLAASQVSRASLCNRRLLAAL